MNRRIWRLLWILCAALSLIISLVTYDGEANSDADLLLGYSMLALSFPSGLLVAIILGLVGKGLYGISGYFLAVSYGSISVTWAAFFVVGYLQWFVLIPRLWRRWRATNRE